MTLLLLALAHASTAVVLPPAAEAPDREKLGNWLQKSLERPGLQLVDPSGLVEPERLRDLLLSRAHECGPWLPEELLADLYGLGDGSEELFLVVPSSGRPKGALTWRFDPERGELLRVHTPKNTVPDWLPSDPLLLVLALHQAPADRPDGLVGAPTVEPPAPEVQAALIDGLMAHPLACSPPLAPELLDAVADLAPIEGELHVLVQTPMPATFLWRYDPDAGRLSRVSLL